jgi:hypothetical protein
MAQPNKASSAVLILFTGLSFVANAACLRREITLLREDLEDARGADARTGVLGRELDSASQARLELIGRTSAPTRYGERTDANRIRIVAFDFGGAKLGNHSDQAGNLLSTSCRTEVLKQDVQVGPWTHDEPNSEQRPDWRERELRPASREREQRPESRERARVEPAVDDLFNLYKGMFRQYEKKVGTTIEVEAKVGPVGAETKTFFSHNFLVLEWRRYRLLRLKAECKEPHVSAIETGIAARIVFNVRLATTDASLSASFGIAQLAAALARNEATVEVSYELVGTVLDLLPKETVVISSLPEYLDALHKFHSAVVMIGAAWDRYASSSGSLTATIDIGDEGKRRPYPLNRLFTPDELAYYVTGVGVGDAFIHINNVESCRSLKSLKTSYEAQANGLDKKVTDAQKTVDIWEKERREVKTNRDRRAELRRDIRAKKGELTRLRSFYDRAKARFDIVDFSFTQENCEESLAIEQKRVVYACAMAKVNDDYIGIAACPNEQDAAITKKAVEITKFREKQVKLQGQQQQEGLKR